VLVHHASVGHQKIGLVIRVLIGRRIEHILVECLGCGPTIVLPIYKDSANRG
jgi:hypothetical protein